MSISIDFFISSACESSQMLVKWNYFIAKTIAQRKCMVRKKKRRTLNKVKFYCSFSKKQEHSTMDTKSQTNFSNGVQQKKQKESKKRDEW